MFALTEKKLSTNPETKKKNFREKTDATAGRVIRPTLMRTFGRFP